MSSPSLQLQMHHDHQHNAQMTHYTQSSIQF